MKYDRVYNFSAGPSILPVEVLESVRDNLLNYEGSGMCVMEMSHRSKVFQQIIDEAEQDLRDLMNIPDNYKVMYGKINLVATSEDRNYSYIPDCSDLPISEDADYVYICENETIHGTTYQTLPNTKGKILVSDQSSMFLSKPCNVSDYGVIYGGVQKNIGPAGMVIVIMREDLIREDLPQFVPTYMSYATHANNGSMYNTPNCWSIYVCGQVFKYLKRIGGLEVMAKMNEEKAKILYDFLDESKMFRGTVEKEFRSLMNVPFVTASKETDAEVVAATKAAGFDNLKGHKSVGGLRASIYNAMPKEGVVALVDFLRKYEQENYKG